MQLGGSTISVGPCRAVNFPWILLDRAIGVFATSSIAPMPAATRPRWGPRNSKAVLEQYRHEFLALERRKAKGLRKDFRSHKAQQIYTLSSATNSALLSGSAWTNWERCH